MNKKQTDRIKDGTNTVNNEPKKITEKQLKESWEIAFYEGLKTGLEILRDYVKYYEIETDKHLKEKSIHANEINRN